MKSRLRKLREEAGYPDAATFAKRYDIPEPTYRSAENGNRPPPLPAAKSLAKLLAKDLKRPIHWLYLMGEIDTESPFGTAEALLVGTVGAGAEINRFDDQDVLGTIPIVPPGVRHAVRIVGDSQHPLQEGWIILYGAENDGVADVCIGHLCVVKVKDGPLLLKTVRRAAKKGLFRLESWNAPPREDVRLEWAAKVEVIRPN